MYLIKRARQGRVLINLALTITCCSALAPVTHAAPAEFGTAATFTGICDASAAVAAVDESVLVLNDEDQWLRFYDIGRNRRVNSIRSVDLTSSGTGVSKKPEMDLEAATVIGNTIYIIASHSRNKDAEEKKARQVLFALDWPLGAGPLDIASRTYTGLMTSKSTWRPLRNPN